MNVYGYANGDPLSYSDPYGLKADTIEVQWHEVAGGKNHALIRVTSDHQERWKDDPRFLRDEQGRAYVIFGAGPKVREGMLALVSELNRESDAAPHPQGIVVYAGEREDAILQAMFRADRAYGDDLGYDPFPGSVLAGSHDSNS